MFDLKAFPSGSAFSVYNRVFQPGRAMNYAIFDCPLGVLLVTASDNGVASAGFFNTREEAVAAVPVCDPEATESAENAHLTKAAQVVAKYFKNSAASLELPID